MDDSERKQHEYNVKQGDRWGNPLWLQAFNHAISGLNAAVGMGPLGGQKTGVVLRAAEIADQVLELKVKDLNLASKSEAALHHRGPTDL